ncbi:MAG: hypothetical protein HY376_01020 [Candidatus Blackburnbacteria bacterium]|nr:hypothetical protein [Candidatus Blackburnbacteria bacterium]
MSRERLLILFGPEGVQDLTNRARTTVGAVSEFYYQHLEVVDHMVSVGEEWGILPSGTKPPPFVQAARETLALEREKVIIVDSVEAFLREQRKNG